MGRQGEIPASTAKLEVQSRGYRGPLSHGQRQLPLPSPYRALPPLTSQALQQRQGGKGERGEEREGKESQGPSRKRWKEV